MNRQMTLAEMNDELGAARTNKKEFLEKLERIITWTEFIRTCSHSRFSSK